LSRGPHRRRFTGGFRTVELNARGWSAILGIGLGWGGIVVLLTSAPAIAALPAGMLLTWITFLAIDRHRHRNHVVHMGYGDLDAETGAAIVEDLRSRGIVASYFEIPPEDDDDYETQRGIRCRRADSPVARHVIAGHLRGGPPT
jgi:hypothetical protein